jgi:hypothetical protein
MTQADSVHSTPRRTASKIRTKKAKRRTPDAKLTAAFAEIATLDHALDALYNKYGQDRESRDDFLKMEARRFKLLEVLGSIPSTSQAGIEAKASALLMDETTFDDQRFGAIAESLAKDILATGEKLIALGDDRRAASLPRARPPTARSVRSAQRPTPIWSRTFAIW